MTYLTVPIAAPDSKQALRQIKAALAAGAEMLELRTDYLQGLDASMVKNLVAQAKSASGRKVPLIVTSRSKSQGGAIDHPEKLRVEVLTAGLQTGSDFIDFEYESFLHTENQEKIKLALIETANARLIISAHNFETKFDDINKLYRDILAAYPAAIPKLVYTANHINDCFDAFDLLHNTGSERIIFCMGSAGLVSRIIAKKLNSFVTFAKLDDTAATAPGQLSIEEFKNLYRCDSIDAETMLYGIIGSPVAHSLSPAVHNSCFAQIGANKLYLPLLVEGSENEFDRFMDNVITRPWLGFAGFSVTIPHKKNALEFVKEKQGFVEPLAEKIGAANTLLISERRATSDERLISAYNTDYTGALEAITGTGGIGREELKKLPVAVIGAGGVARAVVAGLSDAEARIRIYNRTVKKAKKLAEEFSCDFASLEDLKNLNARLVINCTSIGMHPETDATVLPKEYIKEDMTVFDTIYNPAETLFLKQAKQAGAKTISGLEMFINQAAAQFKLFTGQAADLELIRKTVCHYLSGR